MTIFLDTNILLDVLARREPHYAAAARVWSLAEQDGVRVCISAISFNNIYYIVRKAAGREKAVEAIHILRNLFEAVAVDTRILNQAMDSGMDDFEDAIQYFSALHIQATYFVTRNPDDFPTGGISILSAEELLALHVFSPPPPEE